MSSVVRNSIARAGLALVVFGVIAACGGIVNTILADDVAPTVAITSHNDGDMYLPDGLGLSAEMLDVEHAFHIGASAEDKTPTGDDGILTNMKIEVVGYPELSACATCDNNANDQIVFYYYENTEEAGFDFDASTVLGPITIRATAEDWNENIGVTEITLVPPNVFTDFKFEMTYNPSLDWDYYVAATGNVSTDLAVTMSSGDLTSLIASFTAPLATVTVGNAAQESGVTANDFSSPVQYTVTGNDGSKTVYTVICTTL